MWWHIQFKWQTEVRVSTSKKRQGENLILARAALWHNKPGVARVYSPPCPVDTHYQFSIKTLLSKEELFCYVDVNPCYAMQPRSGWRRKVGGSNTKSSPTAITMDPVTSEKHKTYNMLFDQRQIRYNSLSTIRLKFFKVCQYFVFSYFVKQDTLLDSETTDHVKQHTQLNNIPSYTSNYQK